MSISLQSDSALPQGYVLVNNQRVISVSTTDGLSAVLASNTVPTRAIVNSSVTSPKLAYDNGSFSFRNRIMNGGFDIWQRGTNFANIGPGVFTADRWSTGTTTAPLNKNVSRQTLGTTELPAVEAGLAYYCRMSHSNPIFPPNGADVAINQPIELNVTGNASPLEAGRQYTLSFYARCNSAETFAAGVQFRNLANDGSAGIVSGPVFLVSATPSWARYSTTFTMPTPNPGNTCLIVAIRNGFVPNGVNIDVTGIQLEEGPVATPFELRPVGLELALCQRYYTRETWEIIAGGPSLCVNGYMFAGAGQWEGMYQFPVEMRVPPHTFTYSSLSHFSLRLNNGTNLTNLQYYRPSTKSALIFTANPVTGSSWMAGALCTRSDVANGTQVWLAFDAEIL